ncbi:unnamed protein product [Allacma fusca]|uniref:Uncharacterized protein n=1 Tax=Allacma fusca TaxID=39272 RepID=A0A8J2LGU0_9HEXA|nr:unnamed protein product [Allacma fusca]
MRFYSFHPQLALVISSMGGYAMTLYPIMFGRSYLVQETVADAKRLISLAASQIVNSKVRKFLKRKIIAIPSCAIRCGSFYTMERTTTLEFHSFVSTSDELMTGRSTKLSAKLELGFVKKQLFFQTQSLVARADVAISKESPF